MKNSMEEKAQHLFGNSDVFNRDAYILALCLVANLLSEDGRTKDRVSSDDLKALKAMLKKPQPKGFKVFLKAVIESITQDDLQPHKAMYGVNHAKAEFFKYTSEWRKALDRFESRIMANANL